MADTVRYYLPCSGAADHTPGVHANWNNWWNNTWRYKAVTSKISSAQTIKDNGIFGSSGTETICGAQYITVAQSAHEWTTNDSIKAQLFGRLGTNCTGAYFHVIIRVMDDDCSESRGVLYDGDFPTAIASGWPGTNRAMLAGGGHVHVQNAVSMSANDHIVIEVGAKMTSTAQYAGIYWYIGDDQDSDYPEDETTTTQTDDVWVEFTMEAASGVDVPLTGVCG